MPSALTDRSGLNTSAPVGAMRTAKANLASDIHLWSGVLVPKAQSQHGCACFFCVHSAAFSVDPRCAGVRFVIIGQNSRVQWVAGIKKTGHEETTPSDFRKNLRNHGAPQRRGSEKRPETSVNRISELKISLRLRGARNSQHLALLGVLQVCGVLSEWMDA